MEVVCTRFAVYADLHLLPDHPLKMRGLGPQSTPLLNKRNRINGVVPPQRLLLEKTGIRPSILKIQENYIKMVPIPVAIIWTPRPDFAKIGKPAWSRIPYEYFDGAEGTRTPTDFPRQQQPRETPFFTQECRLLTQGLQSGRLLPACPYYDTYRCKTAVKGEFPFRPQQAKKEFLVWIAFPGGLPR